MAAGPTQVQHIVQSPLFAPYFIERRVATNRLWTSGMLTTNAQYQDLANGGSRISTMPFFKNDNNTEPNISTDSTAESTPQRIESGMDVAIKQFQNQSWSAANLAQAMAHNRADPLAAAVTMVADYWNTRDNRFLVSSLLGCEASNIANNGGDMVVTEDAAPLSHAVIDAGETMGDRMGEFGIMICSSKIAAKINKDDVIQFVPASRGQAQFQVYRGYRLIIDNAMTTVTVGADTYERIILSDEGSVGYAEGQNVVMPFEYDSTPRGGNGAGIQEFHSRREFTLDPMGFKWLDVYGDGSAPAHNIISPEQSPRRANVEKATSWERAWQRNNVRLAFLRYNVDQL